MRTASPMPPDDPGAKLPRPAPEGARDTAALAQVGSALQELEAAAREGVTAGWLVAFTAAISEALLERRPGPIRELRAVLSRVDRMLVVDFQELPSAPGRSALDALGLVLRHSQERSDRNQLRLAPVSQAAKMLRAIAAQPGVSNETLAALTGMDVTAVSRTGRRLQQMGLAQPTRYGRSNAWGVTPYGEEVATTLDPTAVQRPTALTEQDSQ